MCVEKNERSTDNAIKTGVQNILGGLVLGAIPTLALSGFLAWYSISGVVRDHSLKIEFVNTYSSRISTELEDVKRRLRDSEVENRGWSTIIQNNTSALLRLEKKMHSHYKGSE